MKTLLRSLQSIGRLLFTADRLVDYEIEELCLQGMIVPFDPKLVNPASLDIRVGYSAFVEDEDGELIQIDLSKYSEESPYWLEPKAFMLIGSLEKFYFPCNVEGAFLLKSSRAREGLNHILAGYLDPGWYDSYLTMEVVNERRRKALPIYPGLRIGQIRFNRVKFPRRSYKQTGRYNHDQAVAASKG